MFNNYKRKYLDCERRYLENENSYNLLVQSVNSMMHECKSVFGHINHTFQQLRSEPNLPHNSRIRIEHLDNQFHLLDSIIAATSRTIYSEKTIDDREELVDITRIIYSLPKANPNLRRLLNEANIRVHFSDYQKFIYVSCSIQKLEQAIYNIFLNSIEAYSEIVSNKKIIDINISKKENTVKINFQDSAGGINQNEITKVFDIGYSTKQERSGLGLCIVKQNITEIGGDVKIHSKGKLTAVCFSLPIYNPNHD